METGKPTLITGCCPYCEALVYYDTPVVHRQNCAMVSALREIGIEPLVDDQAPLTEEEMQAALKRAIADGKITPTGGAPPKLESEADRAWQEGCLPGEVQYGRQEKLRRRLGNVICGSCGRITNDQDDHAEECFFHPANVLMAVMNGVMHAGFNSEPPEPFARRIGATHAAPFIAARDKLVGIEALRALRVRWRAELEARGGKSRELAAGFEFLRDYIKSQHREGA